MSTVIRAEISTKNKYWISRHRYYELKHFCLQYPEWAKIYLTLDGFNRSNSNLDKILASTHYSDPTAKCAIARAFYSERIKLIERIAIETDSELAIYILKGVTEGLSYEYLKARLDIPCCRDTYYDRYRRFFWLLSKSRN